MFKAILESLIATIEATGGVVCNRKGEYEPVTDREWVDLGNVYVRACEALGRKPTIVKGYEIYDEAEDESTPPDRGSAPGVESE